MSVIRKQGLTIIRRTDKWKQNLVKGWVQLMLSWGFDNSYTEQISALYQFYEKQILNDPLILYQDDPAKSADMSQDMSADTNKMF